MMKVRMMSRKGISYSISKKTNYKTSVSDKDTLTPFFQEWKDEEEEEEEEEEEVNYCTTKETPQLVTRLLLTPSLSPQPLSS